MSPYEVLGISSRDSELVAKEKYRKLCKIYHPDNIRTGNSEKFKEVLEAWKKLQEIGFNHIDYIWSHETLFKLKRRRLDG